MENFLNKNLLRQKQANFMQSEGIGKCKSVQSQLPDYASQSVQKNKGAWSTQQAEKFLVLKKTYGQDFLKIAQKMGTRDLIQVRSHNQKVKLKIMKDQQKQQQKAISQAERKPRYTTRVQYSQQSLDVSNTKPIKNSNKKNKSKNQFKQNQKTEKQKILLNDKNLIDSKRNQFNSQIDGSQCFNQTNANNFQQICPEKIGFYQASLFYYYQYLSNLFQVQTYQMYLPLEYPTVLQMQGTTPQNLVKKQQNKEEYVNFLLENEVQMKKQNNLNESREKK